MPGLLRKLIIFAAVDGLIVQPYGNGQRANGNESFIRIDYKTSKVSWFPGAADLSEKGTGLEVYGIVGLLSVASYSFLVSVTQRQQVAQIQGKPVYTITNVGIIPTSSQKDASRAISQTKESLSQEGGAGETASEDSDISDTETDSGETDSGSVPDAPREAAHTRVRSVSNIAEDVIGKKVRFGRFAANWLSRKTLGLPGLGTVDQDPATEAVIDETAKKESGSPVGGPVKEVELEPEGSLPEDVETPLSQQTAELLPKLLRYTKIIFSSQNFFFAYDYDLTRAAGAQESRNNHLPLHKSVDPLYFWNKHLMNPFIELDAHNYVLPLMQGFVGQREFTVAAPKPDDPESTESIILDEKQEAEAVNAEVPKRNFLLTLISRRSIKRPGLRYLRRGVDDDGNTANTVETEQILSSPDWNPDNNVYSYLQVRGSIPLYFSQSPLAFKPVPVLHHSTETNEFAFERHFRNLSRRYGKIQAVSLIDKQAGELKLGEQYERYAKVLNEAGGIDGSFLGLEWFDFHGECRGMKFENVSRLVTKLNTTLNEYGDTMVKDTTVVRSQKGIVRTNCMDCLDRTGVAQCAFGQWALERELRHEGIEIDLGGDSSTQWFNTLWADNGDAISKQYSSTAALKGDYTRTRKRDYRGALNDLGLTLSRYFNNIVNDYFSQACIDYFLGNVSTQVFQEFAMEMQTADPGISVQKLRQNAIETSCRIVISDQSEELLGGWTMLTPRQPNTLRTLPFEESVLLLTNAAVYSCHFDWNTDKVLSFERVDLRSISHITCGTYITSVLTNSQIDDRNVGLVITYRNDTSNARRVNTRSLQTAVTDSPNEPPTTAKEWDVSSWFRASQPPPQFLAFKVLPLSNSVTQNQHAGFVTVSEAEWVRSICEEIERATTAQGTEEQGEQGRGSIIEEKDIISLEDAKKRTGYLEHLVYDIKKLVWA